MTHKATQTFLWYSTIRSIFYWFGSHILNGWSDKNVSVEWEMKVTHTYFKTWKQNLLFTCIGNQDIFLYISLHAFYRPAFQSERKQCERLDFSMTLIFYYLGLFYILIFPTVGLRLYAWCWSWPAEAGGQWAPHFSDWGGAWLWSSN